MKDCSRLFLVSFYCLGASFFTFAVTPIVFAEDAPVLLQGGVSMDEESDSQFDGEKAEYEKKMVALDSAERGLDKAHENKVKAIEESGSDTKDIQIADENDKHEQQKKDLERKRKLAKKAHKKRIAAIKKKAGNLASKAASVAAGTGSGGQNKNAQRSRPKSPTSAPSQSAPANTNMPGTSGNPLKGSVSNVPEKVSSPDSQNQRQAEPSENEVDSKSSSASEENVWSDETIPGRMMKLAEKMDRITTDIQNNAMAAGNEFFGGMADSVSQGAQFLAQKPGTVVPQMLDGLLTYLTNDYNANNQAMYDEAVKAVDEVQKNPARFFGAHAIDAAMSAAGGVGELAQARAAASAGKMGQLRRLKQMQQQQAKKLEKAGKTLEGMAEDARKFSGFDVSAGSSAPDFEKIFGAQTGAKGPVNIAKSLDPNAGNNNCFPVSLAALKRWKTGRPYVALDHNPHMPMRNPLNGKTYYSDVRTSSGKVTETLKREFGDGKAKYPFHDGYQGLKSHDQGIPVASSQKKIEAALKAAKGKSQGLVFVDAGEGTPGHVFNVRYHEGNVEFWDFQPETPVQYLSFKDGEVVMRANGATASVPLEWKRVFFYRTD